MAGSGLCTCIKEAKIIRGRLACGGICQCTVLSAVIVITQGGCRAGSRHSSTGSCRNGGRGPARPPPPSAPPSVPPCPALRRSGAAARGLRPEKRTQACTGTRHQTTRHQTPDTRRQAPQAPDTRHHRCSAARVSLTGQRLPRRAPPPQHRTATPRTDTRSTAHTS